MNDFGSVNSANYMTDEALSRIIFNLETVGKLQRNQVLNTCSEYINIDDISYSTTITRTLTGDSRDKSISRVDMCIKLACEFAERILESKYLTIYADILKYKEITADSCDHFDIRVNWLKRICSALSCSMVGLNNMMLTYEKDSDTVGRIKTIIQLIERKRNYLNTCIDDLTKTKDDFEHIKRGGTYLNGAIAANDIPSLFKTFKRAEFNEENRAEPTLFRTITNTTVTGDMNEISDWLND